MSLLTTLAVTRYQHRYTWFQSHTVTLHRCVAIFMLTDHELRVTQQSGTHPCCCVAHLTGRQALQAH